MEVICSSCNKKIDLSPYSINPHSHVRNTVKCECGKLVSFIPDPDCIICDKKYNK